MRRQKEHGLFLKLERIGEMGEMEVGLILWPETMACLKNYTLSLAEEPVHLTRLLVTFGSKINTVNAVINIG